MSNLQLSSNIKYDPDETAKKRPRTVTSTTDIATNAPTRKSVTIMLKNVPSEEFQVTPIASSSNYDNRRSLPDFDDTLDTGNVKTINTIHAKVIKVIDLLRNQRKRPKASLVISLSEKIYNLSPETTKQALDAMVKEKRIFSVVCKNSVSYRYHLGLVARGDSPTATQFARIKEKYTKINNANKNGANRMPPPPTMPPGKSTKRQSTGPAIQRLTPSVFSELSTSSNEHKGLQLTNSEYAMLKSFLRIISPTNRQVGPSVGDVTKSLANKIRTLIPVEGKSFVYVLFQAYGKTCSNGNNPHLNYFYLSPCLI